MTTAKYLLTGASVIQRFLTALNSRGTQSSCRGLGVPSSLPSFSLAAAIGMNRLPEYL